MKHHDRIQSLYFAFWSLIVLLVATIGMSFVNLGSAQTSVGLGIAIVKTLIVAAVFMNLLGSVGPVRLASVASLLWLSFFILFVMGDFLTRGMAETQEHRLRSGDHYNSYDRIEYTPIKPRQGPDVDPSQQED